MSGTPGVSRPRRCTNVGDVPTMYQANGKQRGTAGNNGHLTDPSDQVKMASHQGERLTLAEGS